MLKRFLCVLFVLLLPLTAAQAGLFDDIRLGTAPCPSYGRVMDVLPSDCFYLNEQQRAEVYESVSEESFLAWGDALESLGWQIEGEAEYRDDCVRLMVTDDKQRFLVEYYWDKEQLKEYFWRDDSVVMEDLYAQHTIVSPSETWHFCGGIDVQFARSGWHTVTMEDAAAYGSDEIGGTELLFLCVSLTNTAGRAWYPGVCTVKLHVFRNGACETFVPQYIGYINQEKVESLKDFGWLEGGESVIAAYGFEADADLIGEETEWAMTIGNPMTGESAVIPLK